MLLLPFCFSQCVKEIPFLIFSDLKKSFIVPCGACRQTMVEVSILKKEKFNDCNSVRYVDLLQSMHIYVVVFGSLTPLQYLLIPSV